MTPKIVLLASATFLVSAVSAYRYVLLTNLIDGVCTKPVRVETGLDCSDLADAQGAIGFQLEPTLDGKEFECSLFQEAHAFVPRGAGESAKKQHFLADPEGYAPWCPSKSPPVKQILRFHKCNYGEKLCEGLRRLRDECETLSNEDCERDPEPIVNEWSTSTDKTTTTEPKKPCPEGWHLEAEGTQCCPYTYEFSGVYQKCLAMLELKAGIASQSEMNAECAYSGGKTISIANAEQNEEIRTRFVVENGTSIIGFQIPEGEVWTKEGFRWVDGLALGYTNWKIGEPNNKSNRDERIAFMKEHGL